MDELNQHKQPLFIHENSITSSNVNQDDLVIICFWCRKSSLDTNSKAIIDSFDGKRILAFGTMGSYPNSEYGKKVEANVTSYINKKNYCVGVYLCQGRVSLEHTKYRINLPPSSPHHLDEDGVKRHLESQLHPSQKDLEQAVERLKNMLHFEEMRSVSVPVCVDGEPCIQCGMCSFMG